ncbi:hypothetical protein NL676_022855 [Syzygium grande]|nr:hypothetical protein NL676_022855 [Syzygium grande]
MQAFRLFVVLHFLSLTSQIFRACSIKKSWDTIKLVLILFAIIRGFLSRFNHNRDARSLSLYPRSDSRKSSSSSNQATPYKWYDNYERRSSNRGEYGFSSSSSGRMRNSSS